WTKIPGAGHGHLATFCVMEFAKTLPEVTRCPISLTQLSRFCAGFLPWFPLEPTEVFSRCSGHCSGSSALYGDNLNIRPWALIPRFIGFSSSAFRRDIGWRSHLVGE